MNNMPWYIWFEILENGESQGKGQYLKAYKHKSSAIRRAKQMWSEDLYVPMTGTLVERIWVVSQTNPWDERYIFVTQEEANTFIKQLKKLCEWYGCATVADAKELADKEANYGDNHYAWLLDQIDKLTILPTTCGYVVDMPKALPLI